MEPSALTAAGLLAHKASEEVASTVRKSTWAGMDRLTDLVRRKLVRHGESEVALATLATHPDDPASIQALAAALSAIAAVDEAFQIELAELVDQAKQDPTIGAFAAHVEGLANVGQIVNLAHVRDVHFHLPGSATLTPSPAPIRHTNLAPYRASRCRIRSRLLRPLGGCRPMPRSCR
jgi:hypothetical protein